MCVRDRQIPANYTLKRNKLQDFDIFWCRLSKHPGKKSHFCPEHEDYACSSRDDCSAMDEPDLNVQKDEGAGVLPMKIVNEKETCQGKFYEVRSYIACFSQ